MIEKDALAPLLWSYEMHSVGLPENSFLAAYMQGTSYFVKVRVISLSDC